MRQVWSHADGRLSSDGQLSSDGHLAEVIGHEIRNPLASAVASIGVSLEMTDPGDPRTGFLERAMEDLTRTSELLTSYLDFGRSGSLSCRDVDLVDVVRKVRDRYAGHAAQVIFQVGPTGKVPLRGDPALLERLVENLVENALEMGATQVDLYADCESGAGILHVNDDGPGVPTELRDTLFDPFVSGRGSSGLGLALARSIIEAHQGTIALVPTAVGAMFRISIPTL